MSANQRSKSILESYSYNHDKPVFSSGNYEVYQGKQKQTKLAVTIKTIKGYNQDILKYLKKLKQCKSENTIRIYEVAQEGSSITIVTQYVGYGNLSNALTKCQRLEQSDAISVSKMILNGYIDLLRTDCTWVGTQNDIEFTDSGVKLSWNNFTQLKAQNCIEKVLRKISWRQQPQQQQKQKQKLRFPKSKVMQQLIEVSKQSASQISLNSHLKKKEKNTRKKGKTWIGLKQISSKNQYMQESIYLAVDSQHGFVRVKIYEKGVIDQEILKLNKSSRNFTTVLQCYQQGNKTIIISEYSNDGSLQSYITRLKNSGEKLKEEGIEYFFHSLYEPLKMVQQSSIKSIGMLHIKNIYIENGIPKIGEPIPMNQKLQLALKQREDVPDFYHPLFKKDPKSKSQLYDTYSLGVLLYKLLYTQYPIFPQSKVHIPSAPNYNKRFKANLQIMLNEGGSLKSLEQKIQVSETVKNQVKQNKNILQVMSLNSQRKPSVQLSKRALIEDLDETQDNFVENKSDQKSEEEAEQIVQDELNCCSLCCHALQMTENEHANNRFVRVTSLEESPYKIYRICTKIIFVLLFYSFVFYYYFLQNTFTHFGKQAQLQSFNVTIATVHYPITISDSQYFQTQFNKTSRNLASLQNMGCLIDGYNGAPVYSDFLVTKPSAWILFVISAFLCFVVFLIMKGWLIYNFDLIKVIYNWDHGKYNFNFCNFIIFNLLFCCVLNGHYYLFNFIFTGQSSPCIGSTTYYYSSSYALFNDYEEFIFPYMTTFLFQLVVLFGHLIMIWQTHRVTYNKLINPIILFCPFLITEWVNLRVGLIKGYFLPNGVQDNYILRDYFINLSYINMIGIIPEMIWIGELVMSFLIDSIYWCFLDKRRRILIHDSSAASLQESKI